MISLQGYQNEQEFDYRIALLSILKIEAIVPTPRLGLRDDFKASSKKESFEKCSILFNIKEGENFNYRHTLSIPRIEI